MERLYHPADLYPEPQPPHAAAGLQIFVQHLGFGQFRRKLLLAASVLVTLPMIIIFFLAQKQLIEGIATTGIKR